MRIYLGAYSITTSPVVIATLYLVALASGNYRPPFRLSASFLRRGAGALGVGILVLNYVHAFPRLSARRSDGQWDRYCVELADYLTEKSSCFKLPGTREALMRTGFAKPAKDLLFDDGPAIGHITGVLPGTEPINNISVAMVTGWAALPDEDAGTVLLALGDELRFKSIATRLLPGDGGVHWTVKISWSVGERDPRPLRAWAYDKRARRFRRLLGEARLERPATD